MHPSAKKLDRKQRNRVAAEKSRRKRQEEQKRLKARVAELEAINDLLMRENERLASRTSPNPEALLSQGDLALLRKLTNFASVSKEQPSIEPAPKVTDFATKTPKTPTETDLEETRMMVGHFKPAALGQEPLQKALPSSSLLSLRRRVLAVLIAPKMVNRLYRYHQMPMTETQVVRILRGPTKFCRPSTLPNGPHGNLLVKQMFSSRVLMA